MSSAHDLVSLASSGASSGVPHPGCLGSSFFETSSISSSMTSVSANFRRGSAQAVGCSLRLLSGFAHPSLSATILTLVQSSTVPSHSEPRSQRPASSRAVWVWQPRDSRRHVEPLRCCLGGDHAVISRGFLHFTAARPVCAHWFFVWACSSASMSITARFAVSSFVAAVGGAASFPSALNPPPPVFLATISIAY